MYGHAKGIKYATKPEYWKNYNSEQTVQDAREGN